MHLLFLGGTVDVTVHKLDEDGHIAELSPPSGGPWGGSEVDKKFNAILSDILSSHFINKYRQEHPQDYNQMITEFEKLKSKFVQGGRINVRIGLDLANCFLQHTGKSIDVYIKKCAKDFDINFSNGKLVLKSAAVMRLFNPVIEQIINHTKEIVEDTFLAPFDYILMVGGFSECKLLQEAMTKEFGGNGLKILVPNSAQLAVMKGAVLFGHTPTQVTTRIARRSYGGKVRRQFDPEIHDSKYMFVDLEGVVRCDNIFETYIEQGEEVKIGEKREFELQADPTEKAFFYIWNPRNRWKTTEAGSIHDSRAMQGCWRA